MGLIRLLLLALLLYLIWRLIRGIFSPRQPASPPPAAERMLRCTHCGVNVPERECLHRAGHTFCSPEHHRAWLEQRRD
ncbi:PP0621 family protein [Alcanivorax quisquiliarum]|uniref:MYND finger n=1 Tax=Alcanivorax quisquiliarum TaxID=2933565 RepID=A0ABT0E9I0_9GAMM|nr:PP0621 family protein [Alcanivorax quisquiliarum]MCK0538490.1 hypothetical protein [Alcanivorax quisquiliarum]